jgi:hypothetical protein
VAQSDDDLKALITGADEFGGPGFLLPMRNAQVFRWSLADGLRVVQTMNLMTLDFIMSQKGHICRQFCFDSRGHRLEF